MPTFEEYVEVEAEMDISPKEFVRACDEDELEELIEEIHKDKRFRKPMVLPIVSNHFDEEWNEITFKLSNSRLQMSNEDIEVIKAIINKYQAYKTQHRTFIENKGYVVEM